MASTPSVPPAPDRLTSSDFPVWWPVDTRWADNDMFGHLNNAVYYQLFDTAINAWINTSTGLDPMTTPALGIVAESGCRYFSELHFPQSLVVGLAGLLILMRKAIDRQNGNPQRREFLSALQDRLRGAIGSPVVANLRFLL